MKLCRLVFVLLLVFSPAWAQAPHQLTIGTVQFPPDMHPYITNTSIKDWLLSPARRLMTGFNRAGQVICTLCTEVPTIANGRAKVVKRADGSEGMEVIFTLKPDLFWADGVPVTAKDVAFAFEVDRSFTAPPTTESVIALNDRDVKVVLTQVRYDFDRQAYGPIAEHIEGPIFRAAKDPLDYGQKSAFNRRPEEPGLWLGPYRVSEFRPNESISYARNEHWKGRRPDFDRVSVRLIENTSALQANLLAGDIDMVAPGNLGLTTDQIIALSKTPNATKFDIVFQPSVASYEHLAIQFDNKLLADKRVRQAMAMAIDRRTIVARLFDNKQEPADSFQHPTQYGWDKSVKIWPFDPKAARALLDEAGYRLGPDGIRIAPSGERLSFDITSTSGNRVRELVEQVIQTQMKAIGIGVVIKNEPARVMFGETLRRRNFQGMVEFQSDRPLDSIPYYTFHSKWIPSESNNWSGQNYMGFRNQAMDEALDAALKELDPQRRLAHWKTILDVAAEELPEINLYFGASAVMVPKTLTGVIHQGPQDRWGNSTIWIEEWQRL